MADPFQNNITTLARRLKPFIMSTAMATAAGQAVKIIVHHRDGAPAEYFDVTDEGWDLAAAACRVYDTIVSPPASYSSAHTVPGSVGYWGHGPGPTVHTAALTFSANSLGMDLRVAVSANDANEAIGIVGPATGTAWINRVSVDVTQAGAGNATGVKAGEGLLIMRGCVVETVTSGAGMAAALTSSNEAGNAEIHETVLLGTASGAGAGYAVYCTYGIVELWGGLAWGSTDRFNL
jgi:hypothetical protein